MAINIELRSQLCERLKALGYKLHNRIRMYGEDFDLISNPVQDDNGFAVEAISRKSGSPKMLRIPLSVTQMITRDLDAKVFHKAA